MQGQRYPSSRLKGRIEKNRGELKRLGTVLTLAGPQLKHAILPHELAKGSCSPLFGKYVPQPAEVTYS